MNDGAGKKPKPGDKALENFDSSLEGIKRIHKRSIDIIKHLKTSLDRAEQDYAEAKMEFDQAQDDGEPVEVLTVLGENYYLREKAKDNLNVEFEAWKSLTPERTIISCCSALDVLLHDFLVQHAMQCPGKLIDYKEKTRKPKNTFKRIMQACKRMLWRSKSKDGLGTSHIALDDQEAIERLVASVCDNFQNFDSRKVKNIYKAIFVTTPFDDVKVEQKDYVETRDDIRILLAMRNDFVHNGGLAGWRYQDRLRKITAQWNKDYWCQRFGDELRDKYTDKMSQGTLPPPDVILFWDKFLDDLDDPSPSLDKFEQFWTSLARFVKYIAKVCAIEQPDMQAAV